MKKWIFVPIVIVILIIIALFFLMYDRVMAAQLYLNGGSAEVLRDEKALDVKEGMKLNLNDVIRVLNGDVTIVFYESDFIRLEKGAEVQLSSLKKNIEVKQNSGTTWSRLVGIVGIEGYVVRTPTSVATVLDTAFAVIVRNGESLLIVSEGVVEFAAGDKRVVVNAQEKAEFRLGRLQKVSLSLEEKKFIDDNIRKDLLMLKKIRDKKILKHKVTVKIIKKLQGWSDEDVERYMQEVDQGKHDVDELVEKSPVKLKKIQDIVDLTKEIQRLNAKLSSG